MINVTNDFIQDVLDKPQGVLTRKQFQLIADWFIGVDMVLSFAGILTNSLNIRIFTIIGFKDGVTASLLALSMSDLCACASSFVLASSSLFTTTEVKYDVIFPISPFAISTFASNIFSMCYTVTVMTTTYLAFARCMCVVKPLHFKGVFTRSRSITINVSFAVFVISGYTALLSQMGTTKKHDTSVNTTRIVVWMSDAREDVKDVVFLLYDTIFSFAAVTIVTVCVIVMAGSLMKSSEFRKAASISSTSCDEGKESRNKLSGKELQVVKQVVLICAMCTLCSLPKMFNSLYALAEPEFQIGGRQRYLIISLVYIGTIIETINSASTFFIYYNYNSAFRGADLSLNLGLRKLSHKQ